MIFLLIVLPVLITFIICLWIYSTIKKDEQRRKEEEKAKREKYKKSEFHLQTQYSYEKMERDPGIKGEYTMFSILDETVELKKFIVNCCCETDKGVGYTEIDLVMFHPTGIYVFESKNRKGRIEGSTDDREWIQKLGYKDIEGKTFYNPCMQNWTHISALKSFYNKKLMSGRYHLERPALRDNAFISYVVFGDDANLNIERGLFHSSVHIVRYKWLKESIEKCIAKRPEIFTIQEAYSYWLFFNEASGSPERRQAIKNKIKAYQEKYNH